MTPVDELVEGEVVLTPVSDADRAKAEQEMETAFLSEIEEPTADATPKVELEASAPAPVPVEVPAVEEPASAKITEAKWQEVLAASKGTEALRAAIDKSRSDTFGKIGGLERTIRQIQDATPVGQPIKVTGDDLREFKAEFPELADKFARDLTNVLGRFKGSAVPPVPVVPQDFDERVKRSAQDLVAQEREKLKIDLAFETLDELHEDWKTVTGPVGSDTPYRKWLGEQPKPYQDKLLASNNGIVIANSITKFKNHATGAPAARTADEIRADRLRSSLTPKSGSHPPMQSTPTTEEDGFNSVKFDS